MVSAISSTDTTIQVHDASTFPTQGQFRLRIDTKLLLCTAVSGTTFTISRGIESTANAAHAANATLACVLTAGGLVTAIQGNFLVDTDGPTITFDFEAAFTHEVVLGGDRTLAVANALAGRRFLIRLVQDDNAFDGSRQGHQSDMKKRTLLLGGLIAGIEVGAGQLSAIAEIETVRAIL